MSRKGILHVHSWNQFYTIIIFFENHAVHNPHLQNKNKSPHSLPCFAKAAYCARRILKTCFSFLSIRTLSFRQPCADTAHLLQPYLHRGLHPSDSDHGAGTGSRCLFVSSNLIYFVQKSHKFVSPPCAFDGNLWLYILWGEHLNKKLFSLGKRNKQKPLEILPGEL